MEKTLKNVRASIWIRNIQVSAIGCVFSAVACGLKDFSAITATGLLTGYTELVWGVIVLQALGGLVVAMVVKNTDNLVKGFATSLSIIISCILSAYLFDDVRMTKEFFIGASVVILSTVSYGFNFRAMKQSNKDTK